MGGDGSVVLFGVVCVRMCMCVILLFGVLCGVCIDDFMVVVWFIGRRIL